LRASQVVHGVVGGGYVVDGDGAYKSRAAVAGDVAAEQAGRADRCVVVVLGTPTRLMTPPARAIPTA
jgi:hypothetical protein